MVRSGTVDHSGGKDPDEGKHCPCALHNQFLSREGVRYSSDCEADFSPSGDFGESVCGEGHDEDREDELDDSKGETP